MISENLKNIVCYQHLLYGNNELILHYLVNVSIENNDISFFDIGETHELKCEVQKIYEGDFIYNENELEHEVKNIYLTKFKRVKCESDIQLMRLKNESCLKTKRGFPEQKFDNVYFYKGESNLDGPVFVVERNNKFAIFLHPNFEDYGFILEE